MQAVDQACVLPPEQVQHTLSDEEIMGVGTGWQRYEEVFAPHYAQRQAPEPLISYPDVGYAGLLCAEAISAKNCLNAEECTPFYLRDKVVKDPRSNKNRTNGRNL